MKRTVLVVFLIGGVVGVFDQQADPPNGTHLQKGGNGAINSRTGQHYPKAGPNHMVNPNTGTMYYKSGPNTYVNPNTGAVYNTTD